MAWEDPTDWVISSCPWRDADSLDWSSLLRLRAEDVGHDGLAAAAAVPASASNNVHGSLITTEAAESLV